MKMSANIPSTGSEDLDYLTDLIGWEGLLTAAMRYGGQRVYIPSSPTEKMILEVGEDVASGLCKAFGGGEMQLSLALRREAHILKLVAQKPPMTINDIAHIAGVSYRTVSRIIDRHSRGRRSPHIPVIVRDDLPLFSQRR
jgi:hypothetical protein